MTIRISIFNKGRVLGRGELYIRAADGRVMLGIVITKRCKTRRKWTLGTRTPQPSRGIEQSRRSLAAKYDCSGDAATEEMMHIGTAIFK